MNKDNLVILNNEKVFKENGNSFLDNLDLKVIPEGLNQFFNVKFIVRKSKKKGDQKINLKSINLLSEKNELAQNILVKVRSTGKLLSANVKILNEDKAEVKLDNPEDGISPGQACVFYKEDQYGHKVLGGGWIT